MIRKYKLETPFISAVCFVFSLAFVLVIQGSIPFISIPTLGQAIWTTGFSQSFENSSIFSIYATNFGNPEPAPISFGLAGAYTVSLFIRLGLHPADAYSLMTAVWLSVAFWGAWKVSSAFKLSPIVCSLSSLLWLSTPMIWWHAKYSMLSIGISLLPLYFFISLKVFHFLDDKSNKSIYLFFQYALMATIAIFMDGYSFMMFAAGSSIIGAYAFWRFPHHRNSLFKFGLPVHIISFFLAYLLFVAYLGKLQFTPSSLDFFRGWGVDLMFLAAPSKGVLWLWDSLGVSLLRTEQEQFGDGSVWSTTFALPIITLGALAWLRVQRKSKFATGFLLVALFGFYMGMGPSLKVNSTKPAGVTVRGMIEGYAVAPMGNAWLSQYIPGFKNMRASYRWSALGLFGLWLLSVLYFSIEQKDSFKWFAYFFIIFVILSNLPHIKSNFTEYYNNREAFYKIDNSIVKDLGAVVKVGEKVAFLPYRNDFFVNYLASRTKINSYNIGGDKNLFEARKHWPETMARFKMGKVDKDFVPNVIQLLVKGEADAVVLPYIDLLWAAHSWPAPLTFKKEIDSVVAELSVDDSLEIDERTYYAIIRLKTNN